MKIITTLIYIVDKVRRLWQPVDRTIIELEEIVFLLSKCGVLTETVHLNFTAFEKQP